MSTHLTNHDAENRVKNDYPIIMLDPLGDSALLARYQYLHNALKDQANPGVTLNDLNNTVRLKPSAG